MKWKKILPVLRAAVFLSFCACFCVKANAEFMLPASVQVIEDGAFQNTAAEEVVLQDSVEYIGDFAFADMPNLSRIAIPKATFYIGPDAFAGNNEAMVISGASDSYAMVWASEHGMRFECYDCIQHEIDQDPVFRLPVGLMELAVVFFLIIRKDEEIYCYQNRSELKTLDFDFP